MNSRIRRAASLEALLEADSWQPQIDEAEVQAQVRQFCLPFKAYQQCDCAAAGDIVTARLEARDSFFNRIVKINVGKGFFDRELESWLPGQICGQTFTRNHSKAGPVQVTLLDVQRLVIPELSDELVCRSGAEGLCSVQDLLRQIRRSLALEQVQRQAYSLIDALIAASDISVVPEEMLQLVEQEMERCRGIARELGKNFDEMTSEELMGAVGQPDLERFRSMVSDMMRVNICQALLFLHWQGKNPAQLLVVEDDVLDASCGASEYVSQRILEKLQLA